MWIRVWKSSDHGVSSFSKRKKVGFSGKLAKYLNMKKSKMIYIEKSSVFFGIDLSGRAGPKDGSLT
ncbi:MAG: hypothetical protein ACTSQP_22625 [Promethearchaeota archaeon]